MTRAIHLITRNMKRTNNLWYDILIFPGFTQIFTSFLGDFSIISGCLYSCHLFLIHLKHSCWSTSRRSAHWGPCSFCLSSKYFMFVYVLQITDSMRYVKIRCALIYYSDGMKRVPSGSTGYFSKLNWGDRVECQNGKDIIVKTLLLLTRFSSKLKDIQWGKIIEVSSSYASVKRKANIMDNCAVLTQSSNSEFKFDDADEDLMPVD